LVLVQSCSWESKQGILGWLLGIGGEGSREDKGHMASASGGAAGPMLVPPCAPIPSPIWQPACAAVHGRAHLSSVRCAGCLSIVSGTMPQPYAGAQVDLSKRETKRREQLYNTQEYVYSSVFSFCVFKICSLSPNTLLIYQSGFPHILLRICQ